MCHQEVVSLLRFHHKLDVVVRQLTHCDYIVSNRMAVERRTYSGIHSRTLHAGPEKSSRTNLQFIFNHNCVEVSRRCNSLASKVLRYDTCYTRFHTVLPATKHEPYLWKAVVDAPCNRQRIVINLQRVVDINQ